MSREIQPPTKVGIYYDIAFAIYLAIEAASSSRLQKMVRSALHYLAGFIGEPTAAMGLGTLCHAGVFEPLLIPKRFTFMPDYSNDEENVTAAGERSYHKGTKYVKGKEETFRSVNRDKEIISEDDYNRMVGVATTLSSCPIMRDIMAHGKPEVTLIWDDPETGLRCKARADWLHIGTDRVVLLDLKTCADASEFQKSIVRYGYHRQMALYARGVEVLTGRRPEVWVCAIETSPPYGHMVARMDLDALELGSREVDQLLARVAECQATGTWPSYEHPVSWRLPEWYTKRSAEPVELVLDDGEAILV